MKKALLAIAMLGGSTAVASAADLPSRKAPPPVYAQPAPVMSWTGFYVGANIGYGWMDSFNKGAALAPGAANPHGGIVGGAQVGYNYQFSPWFVAGVESDFQGTGIGGGLVSRRTPWLGTLRLRAGFTPLNPALMFYGTGGFAYGRLNIGPLPNGLSFGQVATGWTAGGGVEYALSHNWSIKAEYLYSDIGAAYPTGLLGTSRQERVHDHMIRAGLNYHFGWGSSSPVVAQY